MGAAAAAGKQDYARQRRKLGSLFSWKFDRNPLICYGGFCIQLGKKPSKINAIILTLNQRVPDDVPRAPGDRDRVGETENCAKHAPEAAVPNA
jgi:hypothetical protein